MISLGCTIIVFLFLLHDDNASIVLSSSNRFCREDFVLFNCASIHAIQAQRVHYAAGGAAECAPGRNAPGTCGDSHGASAAHRGNPVVASTSDAQGVTGNGVFMGFSVVLSIESMPSCLHGIFCQARIQVMPPATPPREHRMVMPMGGGTQWVQETQMWLVGWNMNRIYYYIVFDNCITVM